MCAHARPVARCLATVLTLLGAAFTTSVLAATRYVATTGTDVGDCASPSSPCRTVQYAIDIAAEGDEIRIAAGTYTDLRRRVQVAGGQSSVAYEVAVVSKSLTLRGGYAPGNWETPDPATHPTTLDAGHQYSFVAPTGTFQVGEDVTGATSGARATVLGVAGPRLRLAVTIGTFVPREVITGLTSGATATLVEAFFLEGLSGAFAVDETVTGGTSGARGQVVETAGTRLTLKPISGTFQPNETLTGATSGATATLKMKEMAPRGRVMSVIGPVTVTLDGLRLTHGVATGLGTQWIWPSDQGVNSCVPVAGYMPAGVGGGLCIAGATVTMTASTVTENAATDSRQQQGFGGGIFVGSGGRLTLRRSTLSHNNANPQWWAYGNGLASWGSGSVDIEEVIFTENRAGRTGAPVPTEGTAVFIGTVGAAETSVVRRCRFTGNGLWAGGEEAGAVVLLSGAGPLRVLENRIEDNDGHAIEWRGGSGISSHATVAGNLLRRNGGGGIAALYLARGTIDNNVIIGNGRDGLGGAGLRIYNSRPATLAPLLVRHNTIANNAGTSGVEVRNSTVDFVNNIVAGHTVGLAVPQLLAQHRLTVRNTLWDGNVTDVEGPVTERLGDVTGPAALTNGYQLTAVSVAVDAGIEAGVATDYDGQERFVGVAPDIGADESPFTRSASGPRPVLEVAVSDPLWPAYVNCARAPCFRLDYFVSLSNTGDGARAIDAYLLQQSIDPRLSVAGQHHSLPLTYSAAGNLHRWASTQPLEPGGSGWVWLQTSSNTVAGGDTLVSEVEFAPEGGTPVRQRLATTWALEPPTIDWPVNGEMCQGELTVAGRAQPNTTVQLVENESEVVRTTTADAQGHWRITYTSARIGIDELTDLSARARSGSTVSRPSRSVLLRKPRGIFCPQRSTWTIGPSGGWFVNLLGEAASTGFQLFVTGGGDRQQLSATIHACRCLDGSPAKGLTLRVGPEIHPPIRTEGNRYDFRVTIPARRLEIAVESDCGGAGGSRSGVVLIDPDGYVFDSTKGFDPADPTRHVVPGSKVTCMAYVPETGRWTQWPAALYNNQVNPQVVGDDGYFAFFTPPGLYYLLVEPPSGFQVWRSPVVEVISEIVHVNVPLTPEVFTTAPRVTLTPSGIEPATLSVAAGSAVEWLSGVDATTSAAELAALVETPATQVKSTIDPLADTRGFDSGKLVPGRSWARTFTVPGTYTYTDGNGHTGTLIVAAAPAPTLTAIAPATGSTAGGTRVTLTGTGFLDGVAVFFGGLAATAVTRVSGTTLLATTPAHTAAVVDVLVVNPDTQSATLPGAFTYVAAGPTLTVTSVTPASGPVAGGTVVRLAGTGFAAGLTVRFGTMPATSVTVVDPTAADVVVPPHAAGVVDVVVASADGQSATLAGGFTYIDRYRAYLAEGATSDFFDARIALLNPAATPSDVTIRYLRSDGTTVTETLTLPGSARATVWPKTRLGTAEFSTVVESSSPIIVDRTMTWDARRYGAHAETAVAGPALTWYLAEGATHGGFDLFYLLQNPATTEAQVRVTYLRPAPAAPVVRNYTVAPTSRFNIWVDLEDPELASTDVSAVLEVTNGVPIIVERAMYAEVPGQFFGAGHESAGITSPALDWFLAEGATGPLFDLFVLIANPNATPAEVEVIYLLPDGTTIRKPHTVAGMSRFNIWVDHEYGDPRLADTAVSTTVRSTNAVPIIVERAMWWPDGGWYEAHNSAGATATGTRWAVAEGEVDAARNLETYLLIANTSPVPAEVRVTLLFEDGTTTWRVFGGAEIPPQSRFNVPVGHYFPEADGRRFGAVIESLGPSPARIVVERAMYWNAVGQFWAAGTNALATRLQ